jgi:hypothetical protein
MVLFLACGEAVKLNPENPTYRMSRAELLTEVEKFESALKDYDFLVEHNPFSPEILYDRVKVLERLGLVERSLNDIRRILDLRPHDLRWLQIAAEFMEASGYYEDALIYTID